MFISKISTQIQPSFQRGVFKYGEKHYNDGLEHFDDNEGGYTQRVCSPSYNTYAIYYPYKNEPEHEIKANMDLFNEREQKLENVGLPDGRGGVNVTIGTIYDRYHCDRGPRLPYDGNGVKYIKDDSL